jgi:TonB family protein
VASAPSTASRSPETANPASASISSRPAVEVTAVTTRDDFLLELGQTLDGQAAVHPVDTLEAALEGLSSAKRAQILVIDARAVANLRAAVDSAVTRAPRALVLVFAEASAEKQAASALKGSKVFAVLSTPVDPRKTAAVFEGAIAEALAARAATPTPQLPVPESELSIGAFRPESAAAARDGGHEGTDGKSKLLLLGAAIAALAAAGGGYWYFTHAQSPAAAPAAAAPATHAPAAGSAAAPAVATPAAPAEVAAAPEPLADTSIVHGKVDELLEKARLAMHERRFTEPTGDNALVYYRSAAAADATNAEARDGLQRVAGVLAGRFEEALGAGRFDEAAQTLANFKSASPQDARTAGFDQRLYTAALGKALGDGNLERAAVLVRQAQAAGDISPDQLAKWRSEIARRGEDAKVTRLAGLIEDRIRDGKLTDPEDSAKSYMSQLLALAAANPVTQHAQHDLASAYLRKARDAALAKNSADEERWLNEARGAGMKSADMLAFQRDLTSARQKAAQSENDRLLAGARDRTRDGRLTEPAQDSAVFYLTQLQASDPGNASLVDASHELAGKLLERARASIAAGKNADTDLAQAKRLGADPKDLAAVQQAQASPRSAATLDPATLVAGLKRLRAAPPEYPENALNQHVAGSVTLQFTVDVNGEPRDIHVIEATPPGVFDRAAIAAIKHWRYAPTIVNGTPVEVPVKTLMRFELPK